MPEAAGTSAAGAGAAAASNSAAAAAAAASTSAAAAAAAGAVSPPAGNAPRARGKVTSLLKYVFCVSPRGAAAPSDSTAIFTPEQARDSRARLERIAENVVAAMQAAPPAALDAPIPPQQQVMMVIARVSTVVLDLPVRWQYRTPLL